MRKKKSNQKLCYRMGQTRSLKTDEWTKQDWTSRSRNSGYITVGGDGLLSVGSCPGSPTVRSVAFVFYWLSQTLMILSHFPSHLNRLCLLRNVLLFLCVDSFGRRVEMSFAWLEFMDETQQGTNPCSLFSFAKPIDFHQNSPMKLILSYGNRCRTALKR